MLKVDPFSYSGEGVEVSPNIVKSLMPFSVGLKLGGNLRFDTMYRNGWLSMPFFEEHIKMMMVPMDAILLRKLDEEQYEEIKKASPSRETRQAFSEDDDGPILSNWEIVDLLGCWDAVLTSPPTKKAIAAIEKRIKSWQDYIGRQKLLQQSVDDLE